MVRKFLSTRKCLINLSIDKRSKFNVQKTHLLDNDIDLTALFYIFTLLLNQS